MVLSPFYPAIYTYIQCVVSRFYYLHTHCVYFICYKICVICKEDNGLTIQNYTVSKLLTTKTFTFIPYT